MEKVGPPILIAATVLGAVTGTLGGWTLSIIIPSVSVAGHAIALGLFPLAGVGMFLVAVSISRNNIFSCLIAGPGGYLTSYITANLLGFSVSFLGPWVGAGIVATVTAVSLAIFSILFGHAILVVGGLAILASIK